MAQKSPMLHSIYDLTTYCRATTGDVPPKLVGASTTVVGSKMYIFGGRLVTERRMLSDLYVFDMESFVWEQIPVPPQDNVPRPRYFHSADAWNNHLIIFGGMSNQPDSINPDELCVLNDVHFFNLATRQWLTPPLLPSENDHLVPRARYAHLSSVTGDQLFIIGGQDFYNTWLDDICIFNLVTQTWVQRRDYPRHCGTYRSVAVSSPIVIRSPQDESQTLRSSLTLGPVGNRFAPSHNKPGPPPDATLSENLIHLPYSAAPTPDHPSDIYLYSNYNFTDVKRELEIFSPLPDADFTIQDRSSAMTGSTFPPGLRFPTGTLLGTHLIIAGTYLAHSYQSFSIWVLDLTSMTWSRIDPGKAIENGSWFRGCLWTEANKFMIFGNRYGNLVDDYNRRLLSWDHVAVVDLEAFGIYQPPPLKLDVRMQELGLATLEERVLTDFEIICEDGQRIQCSRKILEERWEWFKQQRTLFLNKASQVTQGLPGSPMHSPLPDIQGISQPGSDPRLAPRAFYLSEPYPIALAFLQYIYSMSLITPLQHTPGVLGQLLILATVYRIPHLKSLVKHAMHRSLTNPNSVGVYEVTTLCSCRSLQIRALKTVMSYTQKRPSKKTEKENGGNTRPDNAGDGGHGGGGPSSKYVTRPRGTSDAYWGMGNSQNGLSSAGYNSSRNDEHTTDAGHSRSNAISAPDHFATSKAVGGSVAALKPPSGPPPALPITALPSAFPPSTLVEEPRPPAPIPPSSPSTDSSSDSHSQNSPENIFRPSRPVLHSATSSYRPFGSNSPPATGIPPRAQPSQLQRIQTHGNDSMPPTRPVPMLSRVPKRPTTADNVITGPQRTISLASSSESLSSAPRSRPSTAGGANKARYGFPQQMTYPISPIVESPSGLEATFSGGSSVSSDGLFTPSLDESSYFPINHVLSGSESSTPEEDHKSIERPMGWPKQASNIRWIVPSPPQPPLTRTTSISRNPILPRPPVPSSAPPAPPTTPLTTPPDILPPPSSGNAFKRFLGRSKTKEFEKDKRPSTSHSETSLKSPKADSSSASSVMSPIKDQSLLDIERQIAGLEEEKKKLKRDAKLKILLTQTGGIAVLGGMAV